MNPTRRRWLRLSLADAWLIWTCAVELQRAAVPVVLHDGTVR